MCRNIRTLFNFEPPATEEEIRASALQFVRKLSGFTSPSRANEAAFQRAVEEVTEAARRLVSSLETAAPSRNREVEAQKARERGQGRAWPRSLGLSHQTVPSTFPYTKGIWLLSQKQEDHSDESHDRGTGVV